MSPRLFYARLLEQEDQALLAMYDREGLNPSRLAHRLGITREGAKQKIQRARARQILLTEYS